MNNGMKINKKFILSQYKILQHVNPLYHFEGNSQTEVAWYLVQLQTKFGNAHYKAALQ